jgi:hypothetical protein
METLVSNNVAHVLYHSVRISRAFMVCHLINCSGDWAKDPVLKVMLCSFVAPFPTADIQS